MSGIEFWRGKFTHLPCRKGGLFNNVCLKEKRWIVKKRYLRGSFFQGVRGGNKIATFKPERSWYWGNLALEVLRTIFLQSANAKSETDQNHKKFEKILKTLARKNAGLETFLLLASGWSQNSWGAISSQPIWGRGNSFLLDGTWGVSESFSVKIHFMLRGETINKVAEKTMGGGNRSVFGLRGPEQHRSFKKMSNSRTSMCKCTSPDAQGCICRKRNAYKLSFSRKNF